VNPDPVIGVTGPDKGGLMAWLMTALALKRCGASPVRITPGRSLELSHLDGIVIGGGTDVDPFHYGEQQVETDDANSAWHNKPLDWLIGLLLTVLRAIFARHSGDAYDPQRDQLEKRVIGHAIAFNLPILGICRGAQLMNVALGGSLHQNIEHFYSEDTNNIRSVLPRKTVLLTPKSHLHRILNTDSCTVNALHNQSVKDLGDDVIVSAVEPSGVIQAIEKQGHRFYIGVQWHPEYIPQSKTQLALFRVLVDQAASRQ